MRMDRYHRARMLLTKPFIVFLLLEAVAFTQQSQISTEKRTQIEYAIHGAERAAVSKP